MKLGRVGIAFVMFMITVFGISGSAMAADQDNYASLYHPTGSKRGSVAMIEKWFPKQVRAEENFSYQIQVTNISDGQLTNVVVTEEIDENFKLSKATPEASKTARTLSWDLGTLAAGESKAIEVTGAAAATGKAPCCTAVKYDPPTLCVTPSVVDFALKLGLTGGGKALVCGNNVLNYTVTNTGSGALTDVKVTSALPSGVVGQGGAANISQNIGSLAPGESKSFTANVGATKSGSYRIGGSASSAQGVSANASKVTAQFEEPALKVGVSGKEQMFLGRAAQFAVQVSNRGDAVASDVVVESTLPSNLKFVSATDGGSKRGNQVVWQIASLGVGKSKTFNMSLQASGVGNAVVTACAHGNCAPMTTAQTMTTIGGIPAILLEVIDQVDPIEIGGQTTYVVTVTNQGSAEGTNIEITATLEDTMEYVGSGGATRGQAEGKKVRFAPLTSLAPGKQASWEVRVKALEAADARFQVTMTSTELSRPVQETEATRLY